MSFLSVAEAAIMLGVPVGTLRSMCEMNMIDGAVRFGRIWALPEVICTRENFQISQKARLAKIS